jgi:acyl-CoA synthetase (AMP-forming)/AMP-acid ligase II
VHVAGDRQVVLSHRALAILGSFSLLHPRTAAQVAGALGVDEELITPLIEVLRQADLLQLPGERERLRALHRIAFADDELEMPAEVIDGRPADPAVDPAGDIRTGSTLVLSNAIAVVPLERGRVLLRHPLRRALLLEGSLWRVARSFRRPRRLSSTLPGLPRGVDVVAASRFLVRRGILWRSAAEERGALRRRFQPAESGVDVEVAQLSLDRLEMRYRPYRPVDLAPVRSRAVVGVYGGCQVQSYVPALELLAQRAGLHLDIIGFDEDSPLKGTDWSLLIASFVPTAYGLYQAVAEGDLARAWRQVPALIGAFDAELAELRRHSRCPLLVHSIGQPVLTAVPCDSADAAEVARLFATVNRALGQSAAGYERTLLLDEDTVVRRHARGLHWNDEFNGAWHHAPVTVWGAAGQQLPRSGRPADDGLVDIDPTRRGSLPPRPPGQNNPAAVFSRAYLDVLLRQDPAFPAVRLVVFDPDGLLWPGRADSREVLRGRGMWLLGPHWLYTGLNEALLAVARRGIRLACVTATPADVLAQRWRDAPDAEGALRLEQVSCVLTIGKSYQQQLDEIARRTGIPADQTLLVDLSNAAPAGFAGRRYVGDRWGLRRYLMTAPELRGVHPAVLAAVPMVSAGDAPAAPERPLATADEVHETVAGVLTATLRRDRRDIDGVDDLRLIGLDSLSAVQVIQRLESSLRVRIAERHFAPGVLFSRAGLVRAATDALREQAQREVGRPAEPPAILPRGTLESFTALDVRTVIEDNLRSAPTPWVLKIVRSTRKNDHVYVAWRQLHQQALAYRALFLGAGLHRGAVVTLALPTGVELVAAFVGAILGDLVPTISAFPSEKLPQHLFAEWFGKTVARSGSRFVVCAPELHEEIARQLASHDIPAIVHSSGPGPATDLSTAAPPARTPAPDDDVLLQQSSGTTGLKKAVMLTSRAVLAQIFLLSRALTISPGDVIVSWLPLYHDMGLMACLLLPLLCGIPVVMMSPFDWLRAPEHLLREIAQESGTLCWLPNFASLLLARRVRDDVLPELDLTRLRAVISCSEPITAPAVRAFQRRFAPSGLRASAISSSYAMAEASFAVTQSPPGQPCRMLRVDRIRLQRDGVLEVAAVDATEDHITELVSSGRLLPGFQVVIVDRDGRPLPSGQVGEITIGGPSMMRGYHCDPAETARAIHDGTYHSGDLGAMVDGELYVTGRKKDLVIVAGQNIYPHFVEEAASAVPGVRAGRVVAFGVFEPELGTERLLVMAEVDEGVDAAATSQRIAEEVMARVQLPADVRVVPRETLRKSTSGKLSRSANRELYLQATLRERAS